MSTGIRRRLKSSVEFRRTFQKFRGIPQNFWRMGQNGFSHSSHFWRTTNLLSCYLSLVKQRSPICGPVMIHLRASVGIICNPDSLIYWNWQCFHIEMLYFLGIFLYRRQYYSHAVSQHTIWGEKTHWPLSLISLEFHGTFQKFRGTFWNGTESLIID